MKHLFWIVLLAATVTFGTAHADEIVVQLPKGSVNAGMVVDVPAEARILTLTAESSAAQVFVLVRADRPFDLANPSTLLSQADYNVRVDSGAGNAPTRLAIGSYSTPGLHAGKWHVLLANLSNTQATKVTLRTATRTNAKIPTEFVINFDAAPKALEDLWGGADSLGCDVAPWNDATAVGETTLGEFRRELLEDTAEELATQVHSPVPVHIQACWKNFDDDDPDDGLYTLAAATGVYTLAGEPGLPQADTWYAMAPAERLAGRRICHYYSDVSCAIPDIIVWYNSADVAKKNYDSADDEPLIRSVTMHEIVHGLGFLSNLDLSKTTAKGDANPNFLRYFPDGSGVRLPDAYTLNVGYVGEPISHPGAWFVTPFAQLGRGDRQRAVESGQFLVWNDPALGNDAGNILHGNPAPTNLVELYAPPKISPGSTLSHLAGVHAGQLMTAVLRCIRDPITGKCKYSQTLGLAAPILARVGWNTGPAASDRHGTDPITGNWYDPAHDGHGIELELIARAPEGDKYGLLFYTFDASGNPEYYTGGTSLRDGHLGDMFDPSVPAAIGRPIYDPTLRASVFPAGAAGSIAIDFTPNAAVDPACTGHDSVVLALLHWQIGGDSGTWCISPMVGPADRPAPGDNLSGYWDAAGADGGWGFTVMETDESGGKFVVPMLFYYDDDNQPRWATPGKVAQTPGSTVDLYEFRGYCRTCTGSAAAPRKIGTITLHLANPEHVDLPSGNNTISVDIDSPGGPYFQRTRTALRMYSVPAGQ